MWDEIATHNQFEHIRVYNGFYVVFVSSWIYWPRVSYVIWKASLNCRGAIIILLPCSTRYHWWRILWIDFLVHQISTVTLLFIKTHSSELCSQGIRINVNIKTQVLVPYLCRPGHKCQFIVFVGSLHVWKLQKVLLTCTHGNLLK